VWHETRRHRHALCGFLSPARFLLQHPVLSDIPQSLLKMNLESIADKVSQITMYDIKSMYNQVSLFSAEGLV
jgi:hypothetical protein